MDAFREAKGLKKAVIITVPVVLILNVVIGITVISLVTNRHNTWSYPTPRKDIATAFKETLGEKYDDAYDSIQSPLMKKEIKVRSAPSLEFLSLLKPVIHLPGLDFEGSAIGNTQKSHVIRNWSVSEGSERSLMHNGMRFDHGSITVPATGLYFIYSHVKFYVEDNKKTGTQRTFNHSISRYNALERSESLLLYNAVTECTEGINDGAHLEYPSDIRRIAHLNAGDQITASVSRFDLLNHDRDWHYIGAYMV